MFEKFRDVIKLIRHNTDINTVYERAYVKAEKSIKEGKGGLNPSNQKVTLRYIKVYGKLLDLEAGSTAAKSYMGDLRKTNGSYDSRNVQIRSTVKNMHDAIVSAGKRNPPKMRTVMDLHSSLYEILCGPRRWDFSKLAKARSNGSEVGTAMLTMYTVMAWALEYITFNLYAQLDGIYDGEFELVNSNFIERNNTFVGSAGALVTLCAYFNDVKDSRAFIDKILKAEKEMQLVNSKECYIPTHLSTENVNSINASLEFAPVILGIISGIAIAGVILFSIRHVVYMIECTKVDIAKSLVDQSDVITIGIKRLESQRDAIADTNSKDYKELDHIITKQRKAIDNISFIVDKLSDDDIRMSEEVIDMDEKNEEEMVVAEDSSKSDDDYLDI